jgi:hypothetical protein
MTTFFDNQIDLFDLDSAGLEPADTSSANTKTAADWSKAITNEVKKLF